MLEDRVRAVKETMVYEPRYLRHHITNARVVGHEGETILATANFSVIEVLPDELPRILSVGRYLDTLERDSAGQLLFRKKRVVYDSVLVPNTIVYPL
jgi:3-phenylpropionate/cinnamic acid dioxygenase small subunit